MAHLSICPWAVALLQGEEAEGQGSSTSSLSLALPNQPTGPDWGFGKEKLDQGGQCPCPHWRLGFTISLLSQGGSPTAGVSPPFWALGGGPASRGILCHEKRYNNKKYKSKTFYRETLMIAELIAVKVCISCSFFSLNVVLQTHCCVSPQFPRLSHLFLIRVLFFLLYPQVISDHCRKIQTVCTHKEKKTPKQH